MDDVVNAVDRYVASVDVCTNFQLIIVKLNYVQRIAVNICIDNSIYEMIGETMRRLTQINQKKNMDRYGVSMHRDGQRGQPSFNIGEDQLAFLLEFGFKVNNISNFLGVSKKQWRGECPRLGQVFQVNTVNLSRRPGRIVK